VEEQALAEAVVAGLVVVGCVAAEADTVSLAVAGAAGVDVAQ
jgi:hypothetical protein